MLTRRLLQRQVALSCLAGCQQTKFKFSHEIFKTHESVPAGENGLFNSATMHGFLYLFIYRSLPLEVKMECLILFTYLYEVNYRLLSQMTVS